MERSLTKPLQPRSPGKACSSGGRQRGEGQRGGGGGWTGWRASSAGAVLVAALRLLGEARAYLGPCSVGVAAVGSLRHLLADYVYQALKSLLDIDIVLGAGLKELEA